MFVGDRGGFALPPPPPPPRFLFVVAALAIAVLAGRGGCCRWFGVVVPFPSSSRWLPFGSRFCCVWLVTWLGWWLGLVWLCCGGALAIAVLAGRGGCCRWFGVLFPSPPPPAGFLLALAFCCFWLFALVAWLGLALLWLLVFFLIFLFWHLLSLG